MPFADCDAQPTMSSQQKHRIQVPDGLRDVLLEFSIAYLLEQPGDVIDYAVEFFSKLQENRKTTMITAGEPSSPDESIMSHEEGRCTSPCWILQKNMFRDIYTRFMGYLSTFSPIPSDYKHVNPPDQYRIACL